MRPVLMTRLLALLLAIILFAPPSLGATRKRVAKRPTATASKKAKASSNSRKRSSKARLRKASFVASGPWREPTFADSTTGDNIDGDDLLVRRAAVDALGPYNGTVVVTDPHTGRILTIVNQKLAYKSGFQPCSTIKIVAALAGLTEGLIDRNTSMRLYGRTSMNLTNALAISNNPYFANIGVKLGFEKTDYYARLFGLGEKATLNIGEEQPGTLPEAAPKNGGMGMMTSFGEGISLTPLQLSALVAAVANGGTLYYLQYPSNQEEIDHFVPRVKRHLAIQQSIPEITPGMLAAVEHGTARRASYDPNEPIFGKTGTCTDRRTPTHLGWFGSFNDVNGRKLTVVVLLTGGRPVNGPVAAGIAGQVYKTLSRNNYFAQQRTVSPIALINGAVN
ncbi:MAG: penicillin-binding protein [Acidobacteria bacterium]|nr:penicillin-binding protein [Acidobacteriota bacterium]MBI3281048.1 penicillin-binding protein [Acidobacteriota bacterium]